jgi:dihydropteroate synthase-like protein
MTLPRILFVTGKLAELPLRRLLDDLAPRAGFVPHVAVLPITVAALATTPWIARHLEPRDDIDRILIPGLSQGDLSVVAEKTGKPVERGPADLRDLPDYFRTDRVPSEYGAHDIDILAEINSAHRLPVDELLRQARAFRDQGADIIDLGCDPGTPWATIGEAVRLLRAEGLRVSVDSFNPDEVEAALAAGAELVLSVNASNVERACGWKAEVVVIPEPIQDLDSLAPVIAKLEAAGVRYRIDPVLEPIGLGFAASLARYHETRRRFPDAGMMMGVGNLTELTDVDSAGVNVLLLAICQELGIRSVLTTAVINWCRSSVRELALARRLVYHAVTHRVLPKHLEPDLVLLRDPRLREHGEQTLHELAEQITDRNFRLFAERGRLVAINANGMAEAADPFELFDALLAREDIDPAHAFYLGYELAKAVTALTLGKNYTQDQALRWGFLTVPEVSHQERKKRKSS